MRFKLRNDGLKINNIRRGTSVIGLEEAVRRKVWSIILLQVHSSNEPSVKLKEEVGYILNFIELEKIRTSDRLTINIEISDFDQNTNIAPMVLIVFVENAFKHAKGTLTDKLKISLKLWVEVNFIHFEVENSYTDQTGSFEEKNTGIGISTTIQRLDLLYGKDYDLEYGKKEKSYLINLKIPKNATY